MSIAVVRMCMACEAAYRPSSATATGNARSAARIADNLPELSDCPAGRRSAAPAWSGHRSLLETKWIMTVMCSTLLCGHSRAQQPNRKCSNGFAAFDVKPIAQTFQRETHLLA